MTISNTSKNSARRLTAALLFAAAGTLMIAAPSAFAADQSGQNTYNRDRDHDKRKADTQRRRDGNHDKRKTTSQRRRDWREDRRNGVGDWRGVRDHDRHNRRDRRRDRHDRQDRRRDRHDRYERRDQHNRRDRRHERVNRHNRRHDRYERRQHRRDHRRRNSYSNYGYNNYGYNSGYRTNYRSSLGINFIFGTPGYSSYRWASNPYSFYQPGNWSYSNYRSSVNCQRITVEANHYDHIEIISVKQCYNPIDGYYIIQGSERIVDCIYKD